MLKSHCLTGCILSFLVCCSLVAESRTLPEGIQKIMRMEKYKHANWGIFVKDSVTGEVLYDFHSEQLFIPGSTTKIFTVAALLHVFGDNYRFKTPVYAKGSIKNERLDGDLILVAQGDLTMGGGRQNKGSDTIAFTQMDHIYANDIPGASLTPQNPLNGLIQLAQDVHAKGIHEISGDVFIDDSLFQKTEKRGMFLTPILINDNLIDIELKPSEIGKIAQLTWRPMVEGYTVTNEVKTVAAGEKIEIETTSDATGKNIVVKGSLPQDQHNILRTFSIKDPGEFARAAFIQELKSAGITIHQNGKKQVQKVPSVDKGTAPIAVWTSPPLSEYGKLIMKVSHNLGADLIPLLLAVKAGKDNFEEGMLEFGKFTTDVVKVSPTAFVFIDGAGGDQNRLTPLAEVKMLDYMKSLPAEQFKNYFQGFPILGIDGSLADVSKDTAATGKVYAKPGSGVSYNLATRQFFLTAQALAGYIEGQNGHLIEFSIAVNNGTMPKVDDIFAIFNDFGQITVILYENSKQF